jgi:hypothetical protein
MQTTAATPLERYVTRLKDERSTLKWLLDQLETESAISGEGIQSTPEWIDQVKIRLAKIDTFLKAAEG